MKSCINLVNILALVLCMTGCILHGATVVAAVYPNCKLDDYCSVTGTFSVVEIDHVKMGKVMLQNGKCINLSMSNSALVKYKPGEEISVAGILYETPAVDELTATLKIDGRRIGWSQCNKNYIFLK